MSDEQELLELAWLTLSPRPPLTVSQWAAQHRILTAEEGCAWPGPWRNERTPYLVEIMDDLTRGRGPERVVVMKSAQVGFTEAGLNWLGYLVHTQPGPILAVQPTDKLMRQWAAERLARVLDVADVSHTDRRLRSAIRRQFPGGMLVLGNARSATSLRSSPARDIFLDEVDGYPADVQGEGDPVAIAEARALTYRRTRKLLIGSTPTIKGGRIEREWLASDQRYYLVPCPRCGHEQRLIFAGVRWSDLGLLPIDAVYRCESCAKCWESHEKPRILQRGRWVPTIDDEPDRPHGYHLSALYAPWLTFGDVADAFVRSHEDPWEFQAFVNLWLGEPWEEELGTSITRDELLERREPYGPDRIPAAVRILTAGVDVQADRIEVEVDGWGEGEECWTVDVRRLYGDPSARTVWVDLWAYLTRTWTRADGAELRVRATCVDTGYATADVYRFCREHERAKVWAIKGKSVPGEQRPIWPKKPTRSRKHLVNLYTVGVDAAKDAISARLRRPPGGPGTLHFPMSLDAEYFRQLTVEKRRTKYRHGYPVRYWWKPPGARNEALDVRVYALAALHGLYALGLSLKHVRLDSGRTDSAGSGGWRTGSTSSRRSRWRPRSSRRRT